MKLLLTLLLTLTLKTALSQLVGGAVIAEGRDVLPETSFQLDGHSQGWAIITLAVDREGNVTSAKIKETNIRSSIDKLEVRRHALKIKFVPGTHFPKFHNAEVKITMLKSETPPKQLEIKID